MIKPLLVQQRLTALDFVKGRAPKPTLIGQAAMHLGWWATLGDTEALLDGLVRDGLIRLATKPELVEWGIRHGYLPV